MLDQNIGDDEKLYRRVIINPNNWDEEENRPSSAVFKDSNGTSVDRAGERTEQQVIDNFKNNYDLKAIVNVKAGFCRESNTYPIYTPYPPATENIYHAEIHDSNTEKQISKSKARKLAKNAEINWINKKD